MDICVLGNFDYISPESANFSLERKGRAGHVLANNVSYEYEKTYRIILKNYCEKKEVKITSINTIKQKRTTHCI